MIDSNTVVVCDASPIIHLDELKIKYCLESISYCSTLHIRKNLIRRAVEELEKYSLTKGHSVVEG